MTTAAHDPKRASNVRRVIAEAHAERLLREFHHGDPDSAGHDWALLRRLWPYLRSNLRLLIPSLLLIPVSIYANTQLPMMTKRAIDGVLAGNDAVWKAALGLYATLVCVEFVANFVQMYCLQLTGQRTMAELRGVVFDRALRLRLGFFDRTPVGRVLTRVTNDVDSLGELFTSGAVMAVADILLLVMVVSFMLALDLELSLVTFAVLPFLAIAVEVIRRFARRAFREIRARIAQLNAYLSEQVQGIMVVQAYGREAVSADEYRVINDAYRRANYAAIRYDALLFSMVEGVSIACVAVVLWYAAQRLTPGEVGAAQVGTIVAFYQYIQKFFVPIRDLSSKYTIVQSALAAAERIFGFLDTDELEGGAPDAAPAAPAPGGGAAPDPGVDPVVAFEDVQFGYRPGDPVLRHLNFAVHPGEHVAIVGSTGAGKTSTVSLLLRFYEHQSGRILVGGQPIEDVPLPTLRRLFAVVSQDVFLFRGSVADNLAMGRPLDAARAEHALSRVGALSLLEGRGGLQAPVLERGGNFSAGERQLLSFARALYHDAPILILDEATANIDSDSEARLQHAVEELIAGRTAIIIAHRLSTIRSADRIVVFHRGQIVEQGTHQELLDRGQVYAHLHRLQFDEK